jgi:hypothetical protein
MIADLYNIAVINHKSFKGHKTLLESFVLCRRWRNLAPNLGIKIAKSSKYLGVITGYDSRMAKKAITLASTGRLMHGTINSPPPQ